MSKVTIEGMSYHYGALAAVDDIALTIKDGEFFALLGPSGSGKTTLLRLIAGFLTPECGRLIIGDKEMQHVPVYARDIGFVFQNYALFPHLTVEQNIAFGLESRGMPRSEARKRVADVLALVQLIGLERRRPAQLSGGQQQRVALARAIVTEPRVLLLDEPLGALDRKLRAEMQIELRQLQKRLGTTTIFVTHDQEEAMTLADRMAVLRAGKIAQIDAPMHAYEYPQSRFVADFLGVANTFTGTVSALENGCVVLTTAAGDPISACSDQSFTIGQALAIMVRPERVILQKGSDARERVNTLNGYVSYISRTGASLLIHVTVEGYPPLTIFEQNGQRDGELHEGENVALTWLPEHARVLPAESET